MLEPAILDKLVAAGWHQIKPGDVPADFVEQVEASIGRRLPEAYRDYLKFWPCRSGPRKAVYTPIIKGPGKKHSPPLMEMSGFDPNSSRLMNMDADYKKSSREGLFLIADDFLSNWFYLKLDDGSIHFLNRSGKGTKNFENLALVGADFTDFVLRMQIQ